MISRIAARACARRWAVAGAAALAGALPAAPMAHADGQWSAPVIAAPQYPDGGVSGALSADQATLVFGGQFYHELYVANTSTMSIVRSIPLPFHVMQVAISPDGKTGFATSGMPDAPNFAIVDLASGSVNAQGLGSVTGSTAVSPDGQHVFVRLGDSSQQDGPTAVKAFNPAGQLTATIPATGWGQLVMSPDGSRLYDVQSGSVDVIDTSSNTIVATYPVNAGVLYEAGISPDGSTLYIPAANNGLIVMRTSDGQVLTTVSLPTSTQAAVVTSHGADVFVTGSINPHGQSPHTVYAIDGSTYKLKATFDVLTTPTTLTAVANAYRVFVQLGGRLLELATDAPYDLIASTPQSGQVSLSWSPPVTDTGLQGYDVQHSTDGGATWTSATTTSGTTASVAAPAYGQAWQFRVVPQSSGSATPSLTTTVSGGGVVSQTVRILTADGKAVTGGYVTWASKDGSARSATSYALTADGIVTFPEAAVGDATVTLNGGLLPDGGSVSASWPATFGSPTQTLRVDPEPAVVAKTLTVRMPNGVSVVNATAHAVGGLAHTATVGRSTFTAPAGTSGVTDGTGKVTLTGYASGAAAPRATVTYSDGVLAQTQTVSLPTASTLVQLQYMPWLTAAASASNPASGQSVTVNLTVATPTGSTPHVARPRTSRSGVKVSITPPPGWTAGKCKTASNLSGTSDQLGRVHLHVCASASGLYTVRSHGAVPSHALMIRVKGAPPMAPQSLAANSPALGALHVSWANPAYNGGTAITAYKLVFTNGRTKYTVTVKHSKWSSTNRQYVKRGLAHPATWTVQVAAITRFGMGPASGASTRVA